MRWNNLEEGEEKNRVKYKLSERRNDSSQLNRKRQIDRQHEYANNSDVSIV